MPDTKADGARLFADLPPRQICALHSGATVSYREAGPQAGEPVVLLYGIGGSSAGWVRQLVAPSAHLRLIAWDAPGYGASTVLPPRAVAEDYAVRLQEFMSAVGVERAQVIASSWGALTAFAFMRKFPEQAGTLVLGGPTSGLAALPPEERAAIVAKRLLRMEEIGPVGVAQEDAARPVTDAAYASAADYLPLSARDVSVAGFARALDVLGESDGVAMAASGKQPMLIIVGAADQIAPLAGHGRRLAAAAPRARLEIVERCGHLPHFEVPTVFGNLVRGFWQEMNNCG